MAKIETYSPRIYDDVVVAAANEVTASEKLSDVLAARKAQGADMRDLQHSYYLGTLPLLLGYAKDCKEARAYATHVLMLDGHKDDKASDKCRTFPEERAYATVRKRWSRAMLAAGLEPVTKQGGARPHKPTAEKLAAKSAKVIEKATKAPKPQVNVADIKAVVPPTVHNSDDATAFLDQALMALKRFEAKNAAKLGAEHRAAIRAFSEAVAALHQVKAIANAA